MEMARHILAACVVCLLSADHLPCQQHFDHSDQVTLPDSIISNKFAFGIEVNQINSKRIIAPSSVDHNAEFYEKTPDKKKVKNIGLTIKDLENHPRLQDNENISVHSLRKSRNLSKKQKLIFQDPIKLLKKPYRHRRHASSDLENEQKFKNNVPTITKEYIKKIFLNYGENGNEMNLTEFELMMGKLKLNKLKYFNSTTYKKMKETSVTDKECSSINELFEAVFPEMKKSLKAEYDELAHSQPKLAKLYQMVDPVYKLTSNNIHFMCPIVLYLLTSPEPNENLGCLSIKNLEKISNKDLLQNASKMENKFLQKDLEKDAYLIWLYSTLAVVLCGLLGLVGVAIIPFMNSDFYNQILSFLVALAVGTMTGDALLHLIPHSIVCASEEQIVRKGLVCVLGIIGFYGIEHSFTLISEYRKKIRRKNVSSNIRVLRTNKKNPGNGEGDKLCKSKYSTDYCYDEIALENKENSNQNEQHDNNEDELHGSHDFNKALPVSVILREHDHMHHGHSHKHGHVHSPPSSISAVAWMIILGDGLHNFTDGMAIGAAFSESIPGGLSTSLAVFCHELPHELGDFAILIKAGMTPKAAVAYNCLTALLSFFGMIFGIIFGENDEASRWMFSVAAGLFIYIALVDMMPEMTSAHNTVQQIVLQLLGLIGGLMTMLLIALYEHELMNVFGGHDHSHSCSHHNH